MAKQSSSSGWPQLIAIVLILFLGMGFRLYGLDHKVYWHDEVLTSLRTAGYTEYDTRQQLLKQSGQLTAADLQQFQQLSPAKTWTDTWASLKTHPEHPPLFYLSERAWMTIAGSSVAATRGLSALFGIALFPLMAWFCNGLSSWLEPMPIKQAANQQTANQQAAISERQILRTSAWGKQAAAIAIALLAVSPAQILYAQEARA